MENAELTVHEEEGDFFKISLSEKETPQAFKRRVEELMLSGLSEGEARHNAATTPVAMELFYDWTGFPVCSVFAGSTCGQSPHIQGILQAFQYE